jgi:hypothetical protein
MACSSAIIAKTIMCGLGSAHNKGERIIVLNVAKQAQDASGGEAIAGGTASSLEGMTALMGV